MTGPRKRARGSVAETGDGMRAWLFLRSIEAYEAAWRARTVAPVAFEPGPFPIRVQTPADHEAARFDLLAWTDPRDAGRSRSPFWVQQGMVQAVLDPEAEPLPSLVAAAGGSVEGLRLTGGGLVLKIEYADAAVQVRLRDPGRFPEGGGIEIRHRFGLRMPQTVRRLLDFWNVAGLPAPRLGRGRGVPRIARWRRWSKGCGPGRRRARWRWTYSGRPRSWPSGARTAGCARSCGAGSPGPGTSPTAAGASWCRATWRRSDGSREWVSATGESRCPGPGP